MSWLPRLLNFNFIAVGEDAFEEVIEIIDIKDF
jgi:hypothetical protein